MAKRQLTPDRGIKIKGGAVEITNRRCEGNFRRNANGPA